MKNNNEQYNMRIGNRNINKDKEYADRIHGTIITPASIQRVPCMQITENNALNHLIQEQHRRILELSKNRIDGYKYDEVGYLIELVEPYRTSEPIYGCYDEDRNTSRIDANNSREYRYFVDGHSKEQLLFMHNHPNNLGLSYVDIRTLILTRTLFGVTAVGNDGDVYFAYKGKNYKYEIMRKEIIQFNTSIHKMEVNKQIVKCMELLRELKMNQDKYNLYFKYSKRRNII